MDAGIIKNLKFHYRFILANRPLETADNDTPFSLDILDAVIALKRAWMKVTAQTIANCYMDAKSKASEEAHLNSTRDLNCFFQEHLRSAVISLW